MKKFHESGIRTTSVSYTHLYPILYRLEDDGLVESQWSVPQNKESSRKYYCLTEKGKEQLKALKLLWKRYVKAVDEILGDEDHE